MATASSRVLHIILNTFILFIINPSFILADDNEFSISDFDFNLFHGDYTPPSPPPPASPPHPPSLSCEEDLGGNGSVDTVCVLNSSSNFSEDVYIEGIGSLHILSGVIVSCPVAGCSILVNISGEFVMGVNSSIVAGTLSVTAQNTSLNDGSMINVTALAGAPPAQTSGTPSGVQGSGGGHGGRGASCVTDNTKLPEDVWGGDAYSWSTLDEPRSYGSRGGTTSKEEDYGGGGGGRIEFDVGGAIEVRGSLVADGGDGGKKGGGGSAGSIYIRAPRMTGSGRISAAGGNGFAGGGGGRVSINVFSRHDDLKFWVHGGRSFGCPENSGAAGTYYDAVPRRLIVNNHNLSTDTDTLLLEFPNQPLWTNVYVQNHARASVPLLWSRVQVQGQLHLSCGAVLSFGLAHYASSEFELMAEELLMSDSVIKIYGALRMSVKVHLMWNSKMLISGGGDSLVATSLLEASNLVVLKESSVIHSNANLGVHGQGLLNLSGPGDLIEAQRLILSLFYSINVGPGSVLRGPLENASDNDVVPRLYCERQDCPMELLHPPEDCNVNSSLPFTLQICRVEDIIVEGLIEGSVVHFHWVRTVVVHRSGLISASGLGCTGGVGRGKVFSNGFGGGGGHGGNGGDGYYNGSYIDGGVAYGDADLPCELGSGSGNDSLPGATAGGGIIVMGSLEHSLSSLYVDGSLRSDGQNFGENIKNGDSNMGSGGGSGGTILLFVHTLAFVNSSRISAAGGHGSPNGGGGGGGGRVHFHWSDIPIGDEYLPIASVEGSIYTGGGFGRDQGRTGENGTVTGKACPKGLYGIFCKECPIGTFKNVTGSDEALCYSCPSHELPRRATYIAVRGGAAERPCPYKCISDRYHMPHCYTALEELIYTFGGPWLFGLILLGLLILLALVLSVARMKYVSADELPALVPPLRSSRIANSFPFLESLNEVICQNLFLAQLILLMAIDQIKRHNLNQAAASTNYSEGGNPIVFQVLETNRTEESQNHVHRMYFNGPNTFSEPWHLPYFPPEQVIEIVYEDAFSKFVDEINGLAAYQWWEGSVYSILCILAYPLSWSWLQKRRKKKLQRLREFVRSEYNHACLRSCRSRALYEGLKVAATSDLMLAYVDFFLGGDEKRTDLPPRLHQRFPLTLVFGGDGSYLAPFSLHNDNILTSLMSQSVPPTIWYRLVAGLNAQLRLVCCGHLRITLGSVVSWLETHANPTLCTYGVHIDLACFQTTACGYRQFGLLVCAMEDDGVPTSVEGVDGSLIPDHLLRGNPSDHLGASEHLISRKKVPGVILHAKNLQKLQEKRAICYPFSFIIHNTKPVGHQDLVGLVISALLLGDISLVLLTLLQMYSISLQDFLLVLLILPLGILFPFPSGISALFTHGPRRSAGLARVYALWNITSLINVVIAFICGFFHYKSKKHVNFQTWNFNMDESEWWMLPSGLVLCKIIQARLINRHVANLEIQDHSLYSNDPNVFWVS